jgi:DNA-binding response OmpR family regulator
MKILVVEDEHRIAQSIKKGLEQERYTVDVAYSGSEGFDLSSSEEYDCIILDLMLPGMNGLEICSQLRKQQNHTPILILTAKGQTEDKVNGLNTGADDYLTKPFSFEELLARVRALVRRPKTIIDERLAIGDLTLNTRTFVVERTHQKIMLTGKEFSLLEYLMRHPRIVLTKNQIMTHVWDYNADILPNTVEVTIRNLRQKIDIPFLKSKPLIHTKRGFGYFLGE